MRFCPDSFKPKEKDILWAMESYDITRKEVERQLEEFLDHEFRRSYTDWNRCFRNWFRTAGKYDLLQRERKAYKAPEYTEEERKIDGKKAEENLAALERKIMSIVK